MSDPIRMERDLLEIIDHKGVCQKSCFSCSLSSEENGCVVKVIMRDYFNSDYCEFTKVDITKHRQVKCEIAKHLLIEMGRADVLIERSL